MAETEANEHSAASVSNEVTPLDEAISEAQTPLFGADGPEGCDEGHCWT